MKKMLHTAMVLSLTDRQREAVALYYLEGKTVQETADEMHIRKRAVYRLLKDSRAKLEKLKNIF